VKCSFFINAVLFSFLPGSTCFTGLAWELWQKFPEELRIFLIGAGALVIFMLSIITISGEHFSPFLYFEF